MIQIPNRVLIVQTAFLGDVVLALPIAQYLKSKTGDIQVHMLVRPESESIAKQSPAIDQVWVYDKYNAHKGLIPLLQLAKQLKSHKYDVTITPQRFLRSNLITRLIGSSIRVGYNRNALSFLLTHQVNYQQYEHEIIRNLQLVRAIFQDTETGIILPEIRVNTGRTDTIGLCPGSVWTTKRWPIEKWIELIQHPDLKNRNFMLIGGKGDMEIGNEIAAAAGSAGIPLENRIGMDALDVSFEKIASCRVIVSNDSGPTHFAMAVGTPVVTIFGSTIKEFGFAPVGPHDRVAEPEKLLKCRPCGVHGKGKCPIGTLDCMHLISAGQVAAHLNAILSQPQQESV